MKLRPVFSYLGPPPVGDIQIRARANGQCTSWASIFEGLLRHQGFARGADGDFRFVLLQPKLELENMVIKNWHFKDVEDAVYSGPCGRAYSHRNLSPANTIQPELVAGVPTGYCRWRYKEVWGLPGVPAQGNPNPIAYFAWHQLIEVLFDSNGVAKYYDPSYGAKYDTDEKLKACVAGLCLESGRAASVSLGNGQSADGFEVYFSKQDVSLNLEIKKN